MKLAEGRGRDDLRPGFRPASGRVWHNNDVDSPRMTGRSVRRAARTNIMTMADASSSEMIFEFSPRSARGLRWTRSRPPTTSGYAVISELQRRWNERPFQPHLTRYQQESSYTKQNSPSVWYKKILAKRPVCSTAEVSVVGSPLGEGAGGTIEDAPHSHLERKMPQRP